MRSKLASLLRSISVVAALAAAGCSGGGGGGGGGGLSVDRTSVTFTARQGGTAPASQSVGVTVTAADAAYVVAGYPVGTSEPSWLTLSASYGSGTHGTLVLTVTRTDLPVTTHTTTVRIVIARADQSVIASQDIAVSYTITPRLTASPAALAFTHVRGAAQETKTLTVGASAGIDFTVSANQPWVTLGSASGTTPTSVSVGFDASALAAGEHTATVTVSGAGQTVPVTVTLLLAEPELVASVATLSFSGVNGAPIATKTVDVSLSNGAAVAFTATPAAGWIVLGQTGGTTPATVTVGVDPSVGPLAAGLHSAALTFATTEGTPLTDTVTVEATLTKATFGVPASLVIGGADGRDFSARPLQLSLGTGASAYGWTAVASDPWMSLSATSGSASATPGSIDVTPVVEGLLGGTRAGSIAFTATVNGDTVTASVPVTFNLESHKLLASATGVAFTKTPGPSLLTRTLRVADNLGLAAPWTATSDQPWLTVTDAGTGDADLVLTANPSGLTADALYLAKVTIASSDASVENTETIRVGLWVGSAAPASVTVAGGWATPVTDPVRPYAYVHTGGSDVSVFNVHTGALVRTIPGVAGSLAGMAVSGDGSTLHAVDKATWKLVKVDLDTGAVGPAVSLANTETPYPRVAWTRTNGQPLLAVTDGTVRDPSDSRVLWSRGHGFPYSSMVAASLDGSVFCVVSCNALSWTSLGGGTLTVGTRQGHMGEDDGALSPDGSVVYIPVISGYPPVSNYSWVGYSTTTGQLAIQLLGGKAYPNNVEVGWDGRIYAGRTYSSSSEPEVWVFTPAGAQVGSLRVSFGYNQRLDDGAMALSGDALRIVATTTDYSTNELRFVTAP